MAILFLVSLQFHLQKCWPCVHPLVTLESRKEQTEPTITNYNTRDQENMMMRVEEDMSDIGSEYVVWWRGSCEWEGRI